ncbi:hypothetical protein BDZ89DRAFT_42395 [Hymenopellis radicata]|nr:hypothetical protein BDZ89DRAFT_42395 [Hymenopellis radicata]
MAFSPGPVREVIVQVFVYALGLSISPSPLLFATILCTSIVHLALLPILWPPRVLQAAEAQIKETETLLHDEYVRRKNTAMANISARGLTRLDVYVGAYVVWFRADRRRADFKPKSTACLTAIVPSSAFAVFIVTFASYTSSLATRNSA